MTGIKGISSKQKRVDGWIFTTIPLCGARCNSVECNKSLQFKGSKKAHRDENLSPLLQNCSNLSTTGYISVRDFILFFCSLVHIQT